MNLSGSVPSVSLSSSRWGDRREVFSIPVVKRTSSATVAMSGPSLIFSVQYFHDLSRNSKFLHRWASVWKMFCKALDKVIFMYCIAMCGMTRDCLNRWWNILLARYQAMLETFDFVSLGLHYISSVMKVDLSLQREIPSLLDMKEPLGGQYLHLSACWIKRGCLFLASANSFPRSICGNVTDQTGGGSQD